MKKQIAIFTILMLLAAIPMTAFAHGHSSSKTKLCSVKNCQKTNNHKHGKKSYKGHYAGDGHSYHKLCKEKKCKKTGSHKHSGKTYMPHHNSDGHNYHKKDSNRSHH